MTMKLLKTETEGEILIERVMYTRRYSLTLDRKRCVGCEICKTVCPREAIEILKPAKMKGEELKQPKIAIDENKCSFCGICSAICLFRAFTLRINGEEVVPVFEKESFPNVIREIEVDETMCPVDCNECEEACPFDLIKVSVDETGNKVKVDVDREYCPGCRLCEVRCPYNAVLVRRIISGSITINEEKCPENCRDCVDVCPVPGVLAVSDEGKVEVDDFCCVYCGVCNVVCPVEGALEIRRSSVYHSSVRSGAWNKALEQLTSTGGMAKELRSKSVMKAWESVRRRFS
ncbi:MAG: 4Fe-4S dicluster domain-containing protein [Candidatus Bathyarchaeota archaeon]|nr:4Fe-4S dicluster domain-containing protein [Candidatus Bathyarchaeota archaeon]